MELAPGLPVLFIVPVVVAALLWLSVSLGHRLLKILRLGTERLDPEEYGFLCVTIGAGFLQFLPFTMGSFGLLSVTHLRGAVAGLSLLLLPDLIHVSRRALLALRRWHARGMSRPTAIWLATLCVFLGALFVRGLIVSSIAEDDGYHLMAPKRWLHAGALDYLPTYIHTNAPMGFEMLYMIALVLGGAACAKALHLVAGALCLLGVYLLAKRLGHPIAGLLTISGILLQNPLFNVPGLMNAVFIDLAVCWMTIASLFLWCVWTEQEDRRLLMCSALCAGFAGSFKFIALSVGAALLVLVLIALRRRKATVQDTLISLGITGALSFAPMSPWLWRNWRLTGNPVYPMFSNLIPTRDWSPYHARIFERFFRFYNWLSTLQVSELQRKELLLAGALAILLPLCLAAIKIKRPVLRDLLIFAILLAASLLATTGLYIRFFLPVILLTGLVAACLCSERWQGSVWLKWSAVILLALSTARWGRWAAKEVKDAFLVASGLRPEQRDDPLWSTWRYVNEKTPPDAQVLIGAFCPSFAKTSGVAFWVDRNTYNTDSHLQDFIAMYSWPSFIDSVKKSKVNFMVLANAVSPVKSAICSDAAFFPEAKNEYKFCRRLADEYGTRVYENDGFSVYRLAELQSLDAH